MHMRDSVLILDVRFHCALLWWHEIIINIILNMYVHCTDDIYALLSCIIISVHSVQALFISLKYVYLKSTYLNSECNRKPKKMMAVK